MANSLYVILLAVLCGLPVSPIDAGEQDKAVSAPGAKQYLKLVDEFEDAGGAREFAPRFFEFAEKYKTEPAAVDALMWIVKNLRSRPDATRALKLLARQHVKHDKLGAACSRIARTPSTAAETLLRDLMAKSPHRDVRARACAGLAGLLERKTGVVAQLKQQPDLAKRVLQYYGKDYGTHLASLDVATLAKQQEKVYETMLKSFADAKINDEPLGEIAKLALFRIRNLSVGRVAPEIRGKDISGKTFKLSDYRGQVVVVSFWGHW